LTKALPVAGVEPECICYLGNRQIFRHRRNEIAHAIKKKLIDLPA